MINAGLERKNLFANLPSLSVNPVPFYLCLPDQACQGSTSGYVVAQSILEMTSSLTAIASHAFETVSESSRI